MKIIDGFQATPAQMADLRTLIDTMLLPLRHDSSIPGCADGISLVYMAWTDATEPGMAPERRRASCDWTQDFQDWHQAMGAWFGEVTGEG